MNTKKIIGTIIGVILFIALIAGATFAWLTFGTILNEEGLNTGTSMNFLVDYTKGTAINDIPIVDSNLVTPSQTKSLAVVMKKHTNSVDGHGSISLTTTSEDILTTDGVVRWAICRDLTVEEGTQVDNVCGDAATPEEFNARALNVGKITAPGTIILLNDAQLKKIDATTVDSGCPDLPDGETEPNNHINIDVKTSTGCPSRTISGGSATEQSLLPENKGTGILDYTVTTLIPTDGVSYFVYFWLDGETINNDHKLKTYSGFIHGSATQLQK